MPEATAQLVKPEIGNPIKIDDQLNKIRTDVGIDSTKAIGAKIPHNAIPAEERLPGLPKYFSDPETHELGSGTSAKLPESYRSNKLMDNLGNYPGLDQLITGEEPSVKPRESDNSELNAAKLGQIEAVERAKTNPEPENESPWEKFDKWIHK